MKVEVAAAWPNRVTSRHVELADGASAADALAASGLGEGYPLAGMAVFGRRVTADAVLRDGDRLELLRALVIDPKEARRRRAETARTMKTKARG
ncbi:RnfH family protein [Lysobacter pythonis]|uniref:UPF0125 protein EBB59_00060 n=1 Tax=Solilutibacter pythonis TaxID=2483112 RepID=A0A3M2I5B0_9GAMM|nr:RnfH family protein [Lysobacter pythonis]RMH94739.1 RnfH family protein [Lysobacter pythonis]